MRLSLIRPVCLRLPWCKSSSGSFHADGNNHLHFPVLDACPFSGGDGVTTVQLRENRPCTCQMTLKVIWHLTGTNWMESVNLPCAFLINVPVGISWFTGTWAEQMLNQVLYILWAIALDKAKLWTQGMETDAHTVGLCTSQHSQPTPKPGLRQYKTQARQFRQ